MAASQPVVARFGVRVAPPRQGHAIVPRTALVDRLVSHPRARLLVVAAPAGYGKSTLLAQWAARQPGAVAWLSVDELDDDPGVLLSDVACALHHAGAVGHDVVESLRVPALSPSAALARLAPAIAGGPAVAMVMDHLEVIRHPEALDVVAELAACLPDGSQLAIGTRSATLLSTQLLRAHGELVVVGAADLAMDRREAERLFAAVGAPFGAGEIDHLVERTEGWPVGLSLAALAAMLGPSTHATAFAIRGDERVVGEYLRAEILAKLDPGTVQFLTRTALLDSLSGPLCDHVLGRHDSQQVLESIEATTPVLVPLDRHRAWFRFHALLRDLLHAELRRSEPELIPMLHGRAARWFADDGLPETAIGHAQAAGDVELAARLVCIAGQPAYATGRVATARSWLEWFLTEQRVDGCAHIAVLGGILESLQGQAAKAERWAMIAEAGTFDGRLPDGSSVDGWQAYLRALNCRAGVAQMRADARAAQASLGPGSPFRAGAMLLEGLALLLDGDGDADATEPILARAADVGADLGALPAASCAAAQRALNALARGDDDTARELASRALTTVRENRLEDYPEATMVFVAAARLAARDGDLAAARVLASGAARLRPLLTRAVPCSAHMLLELSVLYLALGDPSGARRVLRDVRDILQQRPDLGTVAQRAAHVRAELDAGPSGAAGSTLTLAELRVLPYLTTHLSLREIGERLHVSRHTIKTQSIAIYRKLGVSTRSDAVVRAREIGLLGA